MAQTLKFGNKTWATKVGSTLAYNDENGNYKPLPFNFTRSTSATRVNKEGLIEVVTNDRPRIDYTDTSDGVLLLEKAATNLVTYSEDFSGGSLNNVTRSLNTLDTLSPSGNNTSDKFTVTANNADSFLRLTKTIAVQNFSASIYVKGGIGQKFQFFVARDSYTEIKDGDFTCNGEWQRFTFSDSFSTTSTTVVIGLEFGWGSDDSVLNQDYFLWGLQVETGNPSSYIPTQGSASTRVAETASGSGNSEVFNDSEGVLYLDINYKNIQSVWQGIAITNNNSANNRIFIGINLNTKLLEIYFISGGSILWQPDFELSKINQFQKIALKYKANDLALFVNGFEVATNNSVTTMPIGLSLLGFFGFGTTEPQYGSTKEIGYYDTILTDLELETLTSYKSWTSMVNELNLNIIYNG